MSECNHCTLTQIRADAKRMHKHVSLNPACLKDDPVARDLKNHGWQVAVYIHDRDKEPTPEDLVASFMALGDECEC